ncbi:hypothetical protein [Leeuwenhoekiella sp. MAR_2009_132]|uniref:hypothetical protein n=1 Tax=Leeuwenhoekiella sp. MAR_2009_132 TaxID=1392489 RepID=UPI00048B7282|nr:hypothetical protein [Leeuwenhoekiella sp. MAR_2009_132]
MKEGIFYQDLMQLDDLMKELINLNNQIINGPWITIENLKKLENKLEDLKVERNDRLNNLINTKPDLETIDKESLMLYYAIIHLSKDYVITDLRNMIKFNDEINRVLKIYFIKDNE